MRLKHRIAIVDHAPRCRDCKVPTALMVDNSHRDSPRLSSHGLAICGSEVAGICGHAAEAKTNTFHFVVITSYVDLICNSVDIQLTRKRRVVRRKEWGRFWRHAFRISMVRGRRRWSRGQNHGHQARRCDNSHTAGPSDGLAAHAGY